MIGRRGRARADRRAGLDREQRRQVEHRISAARALVAHGDTRVLERVSTAPPGYLLAHPAAMIVRHCEMLEPLPTAAEVRVVLTPRVTAGSWHLDVAAADRPGLLAAFTGALHDAGVEVTQAVLATWDDGTALQSFVVCSAHPLHAPTLEEAFTDALADELRVVPVPEARVTFDDSASPLYTACRVTAPDEPGLLHAIASGMAAVGVDIHAARVTTVRGIAHDHFDLSDRNGNKLDPGLQALILGGLRGFLAA
jgi:UTP:GlnB (protein PII) uridylyltransferase